MTGQLLKGMTPRRRRYLAYLAAVAIGGALILVRPLTDGAASPPGYGSGVAAAVRHLRPRSYSDPLLHGHAVSFGVDLASGPELSGLSTFVRDTGIRPRILMWYQEWDGPLATGRQLRALSGRRVIPLITWMPERSGAGIPLAAIAAGRFDRYLRASARVANRWHHTLYIRFAHEMNLPGSPWGPGRGGNTPATFVAAWRHVVTVFRHRGVRDVKWVWSPNVECSGHCPFRDFYPGDAWVDWVSLDGYNYGSVDHVAWMSFKQVFARSYADLVRLSPRPVMIGETASTPTGGDEPAWIHGMGSALAHVFTRVRAVVWFDRIKETDWRLNSDPATLEAFHQVLASPPFAR